MELSKPYFTIELLLKEWRNIHRWDRPVYFVALMLRDGFEVIAARVPEELRPQVEECIRIFSESDELPNWVMATEPNVHRQQFREWRARLERDGWPQQTSP